MFSKTSQNIRLQGNSILVADCKKQDGSSKSSSLDLDTLLGNVDGKFTRGQRTFSKTARNIALKGLILSAELKNSSEVWVPATVDLDALIANNDGLLEGVSVTGLAKMPSKVDVRPPPLTRTSTEEPLSAKTLVDSASVASFSKEELLKTALASYKEEHSSFAKTTSTSTTTSSSSHAVVYFRNLRLENATILFADCLASHGMTYTTSSIDLNDYIGNINGQLTWGYKDFKKSSRGIVLKDGYLIAECKNEREQYVTSRLELTKGLHCDAGKLEVMVPKINPEFSKFMSEAPWMKFKVVTEPQMDLLLTHKVVQNSFESIAETTVKHVTSRMTRLMSVAIAAAVEEVTISAMEHVRTVMALQIESSLRAEIRPSQTDASLLTMQMQQMLKQELGTIVKEAVVKELNGNGVTH